jgi:hypothetical protein
MNTVRYLAVSTVLAAGMAMTPANAVSINFDEFASPPVTCCYGSTGVTGPLNYPSVTVTAGDGGYVMNGSGWSNEQTSGYNLFGTLSGVIYLDFTHPVSNLALDVINGEGGATFTVDLYGGSGSTRKARL